MPDGITYMWNLKYNVNEAVYKTETDRDTENRCVVAAVGHRRQTEWEFTISRCKLLSVECTNSRVLLHNIGNYIQYPLINHNGREYEKECIHMYN